MSSSSPTLIKPPRLILCVLIFAVSLAAAITFASAYKEAPASSSDPTLCGNPAPIAAAKPDTHAAHDKAEPIYYDGGLWSAKHRLAGVLDSAILSVAKGRPVACASVSSNGESLVVIDRSPIVYPKATDVSQDNKPDLIVSIDYAGGISSSEYPGGAALQKYITDQRKNYNSILIIEPFPGPDQDPDEDWTYLNFNGDDNIAFFTPERNATPSDILHSVYKQLRGSAPPASTEIPILINSLIAEGEPSDLDAHWQLANKSPYAVIPALDQWVAASTDTVRDRRVFEALSIRRAMGVHSDELIAEAAASENPTLRALAARSIGSLAEVTTDPIGLLTPLAEDDDMSVRYEALVATRAMPGRRAAGVAQLVEPYEMTDAMRTVYQGTMAQLLTYGEPVQADSKANRLRRMAMSELLKQDRSALVCRILLERTDLPDDKIDEVLSQLAKLNGRGILTELFDLLATMNPSTLAKREVLLKKLIAWKTGELKAQTPRLKEIALGNGARNKRSAAAAAMIMSSEISEVFAELGGNPIAYEGLAWVSDPAVLKRWAEPISLRIMTQKAVLLETTIAAIDAVRLLPDDAVTQIMADGLLSLAHSPESNDLRFAAIRALNAFPASLKPADMDDLALTTIKITAVSGMKYDKQAITVIAGRPVELTLINPDTMEHNLVITHPGRAQEIGIAMSADPTAAAAIGYVPKDSDAVLHYTKMVSPGTSDTLRFFAPTKPGRYEYVCTYPGHYTSMRGVLEVVAP